MPFPSGHNIPDTGRDAIGLLGHTLDHVLEWVGIHSCPLFSQTTYLESVSCDAERSGRWQIACAPTKKNWKMLERGRCQRCTETMLSTQHCQAEHLVTMKGLHCEKWVALRSTPKGEGKVGCPAPAAINPECTLAGELYCCRIMSMT